MFALLGELRVQIMERFIRWQWSTVGGYEQAAVERIIQFIATKAQYLVEDPL